MQPKKLETGRILREALGDEAYPYESEGKYEDESAAKPASKIDWDDGEDTISTYFKFDWVLRNLQENN